MANLNQTGYETLSVTDTAVGLASIPTNGARYALITVTVGAISWRADGTTVTSTTGEPTAVGERIDWTDSGHNHNSLIAKFSAVRTSGTSATLRVTYFN